MIITKNTIATAVPVTTPDPPTLTMKHELELNPPEYDPNLLIDSIISTFRLKNDAALAHLLGMNRAVVSRLRNRRTQLTPGVMICLHEATGLSIRELRALMDDKRPYCLLRKKPAHREMAGKCDELLTA